MKKGKRFTIDFIYGTIGLVAMNAVTSLLVYPFLERSLGADMQGRILFFTSLAALLAGGFGSAANYGRLKVQTEEGQTKNGEYNVFLLSSAVVVAAVAIAAVILKKDSAGTNVFALIALMFVTVVRYYADVDFRLVLNYKKFCLYYLAAAAGYALGLLFFQWTGAWVLIFLTGDLFAILFTVIFGKIFRKPFFQMSERKGAHFKMLWGLAGAYLLSDFVGSSDRLLLPLLVANGNEYNALYYYASVVGKIASLLSTPLNGVLAGHLAKSEGKLSRKKFLKILALMLGIFAVVTALAFGASHLFVWLFYRTHYEEVKPLFLLANAGQVLFFVCNTLMVVVLRYTHPRNQLITGIVYVAAFFAITVPLILTHGLYGMALGILITNAVKFLAFALLGTFGVAGRDKPESAGNENDES